MKDILIVNEFYWGNFKFLSKKVQAFINFYKMVKFNNFIKSLIKKDGNDIKIEVISANDKKLKLSKSVGAKFLSDIRINLDRSEYLKIESKVSKSTKENFAQFFTNLMNFKSSYLELETLFIPKILEFDLINYFNTFFGNFEVINSYIQKRAPDRLILFNCNPYSLKFFQSPKEHKMIISIFNDPFLKIIKPFLKLINFIQFLLFILLAYFKSKFHKPFQINKESKKYADNNILFVIKTKNQYKSVEPVYNILKEEKNFNPIYYFIEVYSNFRDIVKLFRFLFHIRRFIFEKQEKLSCNLTYDLINLQNILKIFEGSQFFIKFVYIFNFKNNLTRFIGNQSPSLVIIGNDFKDTERIVAGYFKSKGIPTLYVPHAAIPMIEEFVSIPDIEYYVLGGEQDKSYYISKGIPEENIKVVGIPRYENLYKGNVKKLKLVKDMFNGTSYNFSKDKFTIILTTNPIDDKSNEKIITSVVNSLKKLNLIDNLIIKLHPHENGKIHREISQKLEVNPIIVKSYNILDLIKSCDLLISQKSTTLLEAVIIGTPMVLLDFINKDFRESSKYGFLDKKNIPTAKDQESLIKEIKKIVALDRSIENLGFKQKEFATKFSYYDHKEPPIQKISNFILKIKKN